MLQHFAFLIYVSFTCILKCIFYSDLVKREYFSPCPSGLTFSSFLGDHCGTHLGFGPTFSSSQCMDHGISSTRKNSDNSLTRINLSS